MPFIPHTEKDVNEMLAAIGAKDIDTLFDEIPANLRCQPLSNVPEGINELQLNQLAEQKCQHTASRKNFLGGGAYEHHIPACVWDITTRGEFLTAYTPYQAEASQGSLQLLYEFQTMMAKLTGMDVSNASLYDGGSALAEAVLMAIRGNRKSKSKRILITGKLNPWYLETLETIVKPQGVEFVCVDDDLKFYSESDVAGVVVQYPNFMGNLESVDSLTDWAHGIGALVIAVVNPIAMALLTPPGEWGSQGADIVCGEGQPLGVPLASGGPYFGFMTCKQAFVRQLPGRLIGRTVDLDGKEGFALTLQAREQHIRRSKATSNICTNQGLLVTAATIYMSVMGDSGLKAVARDCHLKTKFLLGQLMKIEGVERVEQLPYFHEVAIKLPCPVDAVIKLMQAKGIEPGINLKALYPELGEALLFSVTETKTEEDLHNYCQVMSKAIAKVQSEVMVCS